MYCLIETNLSELVKVMLLFGCYFLCYSEAMNYREGCEFKPQHL